MTTREPLDIDDYQGENLPGHIVNPDAWQARPSAGARLMGWGIVALAVVVWAVVAFVAMGGTR